MRGNGSTFICVAMLLGVDQVHRQVIDGLSSTAFEQTAEISGQCKIVGVLLVKLRSRSFGPLARGGQRP
jgi:hypothetical protein